MQSAATPTNGLQSATEKQIKSFYRKLSLTHHPDKLQPDPAKNLTIEAINDQWVEFTKAFKALTDEEVRNNYLQYGHPDGKQSFSIGIALPKWIVTEGHGRYVLLGYGIVLGVVLPYLVGKWWYGTQRVTKEKVLVSSAGNIFKEYKPDLNEGGVLAALATGTEFEEALRGHKAEAGLSKVESKLFQEGELSPLAGGLSVKDRRTLEELDEGARRKALALLWAYLGRVELEDPTLNAGMACACPFAFSSNSANLLQKSSRLRPSPTSSTTLSSLLASPTGTPRLSCLRTIPRKTFSRLFLPLPRRFFNFLVSLPRLFAQLKATAQGYT